MCTHQEPITSDQRRAGVDRGTAGHPTLADIFNTAAASQLDDGASNVPFPPCKCVVLGCKVSADWTLVKHGPSVHGLVRAMALQGIVSTGQPRGRLLA